MGHGNFKVEGKNASGLSK